MNRISIIILFSVIFSSACFCNDKGRGEVITDNGSLSFTPSMAYASAAGGGVVGLFVGGAVGYGFAYLSGLRSSDSEMDGIGIAIVMILGASIGVPVGAATNLYYDSNKSSPYVPLLVAAAAPEMMVVLLSFVSGQIISSPILLVVGWILAPISVAAYYNHYKKHQSKIALLNISKDQVNFRFPKLDMKVKMKQSNHYHDNVSLTTATLEYKINLLTIEF